MSLAVAAVASAAAVVSLWCTPGAWGDPGAEFPSDDHGYLNTAAHCDAGQTVLMFGRTARSLVAVCVGPDGQLKYRGVRLSDRAGLVIGAGREADGAIIATNEVVTYAVSPNALVVSEGDTVLSRDTWEEFREPSSTPGPATSSAPATSSTAPATSSTAPATSSTAPATTSPTVSTTTVTPTPKKSE